jgi:myosin heavy subunit
MKSTTTPEGKASTRKSARGKAKEEATSCLPASQRPPDPRVGTRSVNTLSEAQLERKRANDREAQRIIRKRTREHIETLERQVAELGDQKEQLSKALQHNSELEAQIAALQRQITDMALLLQYQQSPRVHGYTDTAPTYATSSCVLPSPLVLLPRKLIEHRSKCNERAHCLFSASVTRIYAPHHRGIAPTVHPL